MKISSEPDPLLAEHGPATIGGLRSAPEIAKMLGIYLTTVSLLEIILPAFYGYAAGTQSQANATKFSKIAVITNKINSIQKLLDDRKDQINSMDYSNALALVERARAINDRRNDLVHGVYRTYEKTGLVVVSTWIFSENKESKGEYLTVEGLTNDIREIQIFAGDVLAFVGFDMTSLVATESYPI